jgi:gentisate 1,2-dioxygenase
MSVIIDTVNATLKVPDIGVTLRTLLGCAAQGYKTTPKRVWKIIYGDGNVVIGSVRLKNRDFIQKEKLDDNQSSG